MTNQWPKITHFCLGIMGVSLGFCFGVDIVVGGLKSGRTESDPAQKTATRKGESGILKSEVGDTPIMEVVALCPKLYSIKLFDGSTKAAMKGVNTRNIEKITHADFVNILDHPHSTQLRPQHSIQKINGKMLTIRSQKIHCPLLKIRDIGCIRINRTAMVTQRLLVN